MSRPWMRSMPTQPEENYGTPQNQNFTQGQTSQQDSETAFTQVCRLYEQSQQQHQEMMNELQQKVEKAARDKASIAMAIRSLSYSEREAIEHIFEELGAKEGLLIASKVADRVGITRSVIVNALRKLESAGVIESRSLGMKGTFIRVKKEGFLKELEKEAF